MAYDFAVTLPADTVSTTIYGSDRQGLLITAAFAGQRGELNDAALWRAFVTHPLLTLKVIAGIHYEAVKILLKGVRMTRRPPAPPHPVTVGRGGAQAPGG